MKPNLSNYIFRKENDVASVLSTINDQAHLFNGRNFGLIVDEGNLVAVFADGDIRRAFLTFGDACLSKPIISVANANFSYLEAGYSYFDAAVAFEKGVTFLPVVEHDRKLVDVLFRDQLFDPSSRNAVIYRARAPMRVSFGGGGTDLSDVFQANQGKVFSSTINKYAWVTIIPRNDAVVEIRSFDFETVATGCIDDQNKLKFDDFYEPDERLLLLKRIIEFVKIPRDVGFTIEISLDCLPRSGLGGSSSLTVACLLCFNEFLHRARLSNYDLASLAYHVESNILLSKCGWQDQVAAVYGGFNRISFSTSGFDVSRVAVDPHIVGELEASIILARIPGERKATKKDVKDKARSLTGEQINSLMSRAMRSEALILTGDIREFGLELGAAMKEKLDLVVAGSDLDNGWLDVYNKVLNLGAWGGKILGSGGGGYLLFCCSPQYRRSIEDYMVSVGYLPERVTFTDRAAECWKRDF